MITSAHFPVKTLCVVANGQIPYSLTLFGIKHLLSIFKKIYPLVATIVLILIPAIKKVSTCFFVCNC